LRWIHVLATSLLTLASLIPPLVATAYGATLTPDVRIAIPGTGFNSQAGGGADIITYDPGTALIYLTDGANNAIDVFDPATNSMVGRIPTQAGPHQIYVDNDKHLMYAALGNKKVTDRKSTRLNSSH